MMSKFLQRNLLRSIFIFSLVLAIQLNPIFAAAADDNSPVRKPEIRLEPGIPIASPEKSSQGMSGTKLGLISGAVVLVAGAVVALVAAGGSDSGDSSPDPDTGSYFIDW